VSKEQLTEAGLSPREVTEWLLKLAPKPVPDFELDLASAKTGAYFAERFEKAVPKGDRAPSEG
jgi:hypothetical protein